ncbi:hypothetical protein [Candidatus Magnetaquicoccus inordinatus]|uniref:hypothetical protein n=1 Tax=Candidatus Magnetaquicoccus inordinatus TaxID=2496818 RepID=UPI00102BE4D9|nr:hypothetical protein [Candidatus Magnetaquicoccus inordinatus]
MSVTLLFCEGNSGSPDALLLGKLLAGLCMVKPGGSKHGMGGKIIDKRLENIKDVYGILDGDFAADWQPPTGKLHTWQAKDGTHFGWRWERTEIENYLLDPDIVGKALGDLAPNYNSYVQALAAARDRIAIYQAARTALRSNRPKYHQPLASCFGRARGREKYCFPDALDEGSCLDGLKKNVAQYTGANLVQESVVLNSFTCFLSECCPGGKRYQNYLSAFSGKDLLLAMEDWLKANGYAGAFAFREKILQGLHKSSDDIALWLPEWQHLRTIVQ